MTPTKEEAWPAIKVPTGADPTRALHHMALTRYRLAAVGINCRIVTETVGDVTVCRLDPETPADIEQARRMRIAP